MDPRPSTTWTDFADRWGGVFNFLMAGELVDFFHFDLPPIDQLVDEVRKSEGVIFRTGAKQDEFVLEQIADARTMPLEKLFERPFVLAHFKIAAALGAPGQVFHGIEERWVQPWRDRLTANGFTFENIFPILFVSGPNSATQYHMDYTHQLAWQRYGTKHFHGLKDPDRWTTHELRGKCELKGMKKPQAITAADTYTLVQTPGTMLWNAVTTPHWVETFNEPAATLTLVHAGLRHNGQLCPHGEEWTRYRAAQAALQPEQKPAGSYG
ncbi:MAG: hypothetical protein K8S99_05455 [Planctomycetes bacterium]|nr:hypothetical protein [Planctomycetota bacterium]